MNDEIHTEDSTNNRQNIESQSTEEIGDSGFERGITPRIGQTVPIGHNKATSEIQEEEISSEEKEIAEVKTAYISTPKFTHWAELFLDKNNKKTYGNATESAMQSYNCKNRVVAGVIGTKNIRKVRDLASIYADDKGFTMGKMMDIAFARALSSEGSEWWSLVMDMTGRRDLKPSVVVDARQQTINHYDLNSPEVLKVNKAIKEALMGS